MARILGAKCRLCRRAGMKLFLKGTRCDTAKCPMEKDGKPPGQHADKRVRLTDFGIHAREVQRAKRMYGVLQRQFTRYYSEAAAKPGNTGEFLLQELERRLDNVVYRLRFSVSRDHGRQLVLHGHLRLNGKKINVPSIAVSAGDVITVAKREKSQKIVKDAYALRKAMELPSWLRVSEEPFTGTVVNVPAVSELQVPIDAQLIVEYMSR